jgi:hypothetical protein
MKNTGEPAAHQLSRRDFLKNAGFMTAGAMTTGAVAGLIGCSAAPESTSSYLPNTWDYEADIVVVGYGGAGASAAITATTEGLGEVLVLEAAPLGSEGGNTRVSGNLMFIPDNAEDAIKYQTALNGPYIVEPDLMKAWASEIVKNVEWVESLGGDMQEMPLFSPEFPEFEGSETVKTYCVDGQFNKPSLWTVLKAQEESLGISVLYETRASRLIYDQEIGEVFGVVADQNGKDTFIKARKGVVLSCGGFENNPEMLQTYYHIGVSEVHPLGTPYNRGDGFKLIAPLGAQLWHMNNTAGTGYGVLSGGYDVRNVSGPRFKQKDYIYVGADAKRFMFEEKGDLARHGKLYEGGCWVTMSTPTPAWIIFGTSSFNDDCVVSIAGTDSALYANANSLHVADSNQGFLEAGIIFSGDTVEELASKIKLSPETLASTVETYNTFVRTGKDEEFGRGEDVYDTFNMEMNVAQSGQTQLEGLSVVIPAFPLEPISGPPYYAIQIVPRILNTQGGPKRSANGGIVNVEGNQILRLYAAGEFGCEYSYQYNGGGNVSEAISSGRIAVRSIGSLAPWDETT